MSSVTRTSHTVGSATLSVLAAGRGDTVVLLHGIPASSELWRGLLGSLGGAGFHALAPDLPGYGDTQLPKDGDYSLRGAADLLGRWLVESGLSPAWIVGHDAGGAVAQHLAVRWPQVVGRLTLTNSIVDGSWPAPRALIATLGARMRLYRVFAASRLIPNPYIRREIRRAFADSRHPAAYDQDRVLWDGKITDPRGRREFERHLAALTARDTATIFDHLPALAMPCQLVWGMDDPFQPWSTAGRRLHEQLPAAAVTRLESCGHFTPLECPERLLDALLEWVRADPSSS